MSASSAKPAHSFMINGKSVDNPTKLLGGGGGGDISYYM